MVVGLYYLQGIMLPKSLVKTVQERLISPRALHSNKTALPDVTCCRQLCPILFGFQNLTHFHFFLNNTCFALHPFSFLISMMFWCIFLTLYFLPPLLVFFLFIILLVFFAMQSQEVSYSLNGRQKRNQIKFVSPSLTTKDLPVGFLHRQKLLVLVPSVQFCLIQKQTLDCTDAGGYFQ